MEYEAVPFLLQELASGWGATKSNDEYLQQCQDDLLVMLQVETPRGVEAIDEIAETDGVDLIFLGPFDLSASASKMGQFDDPDVQDLIRRAEQAVIKSPCLLGGFRSPGRDLECMFNDGYSLVCGSVDLGLLREAARIDANTGKDATGNSGN
mgnify:CR=1 FL=1